MDFVAESINIIKKKIMYLAQLCPNPIYPIKILHIGMAGEIIVN